MRWRSTLLVCLLALPLALSAAPQQDQEKPKEEPERRKRNWWGLDIGAYFPTDSEIQDRFGDAMLRIGLRPFDTRAGNWRFVTDITFLSGNRDGSRMLIVPLTFGFLKSFGDPDAEQRTFVMFGAGPAYYDYSIKRLVGLNIVKVKDRTFGASAHVDAGIVFNNRFSIVARYDWMSESKNFDFSGFSLTLSYALFRL